MRRSVVVAAVVAAAALAGCAGADRAVTRGERPFPTPEIAALDARIAGERDPAQLAKLLFERGHLAMEEGERYLEEHADPVDRTKGFEVFGGYFMRAISDFSTIVRQYPDSAEAPEAMFHLGVIFDYPDMSDFDTAVEWYRKVIERYPGTESARKARTGIDRIEAVRESFRTKGRGEGELQ